MFNNIKFTNPHIIRDLFGSFKPLINRFDDTKKDFSIIVKLFEEILDAYNELCICKPVEEIKDIKAIQKQQGTIIEIPEFKKDEYSKNKDSYTHFLRNYEEFAKKANRKFGEKICREYYEMPKDL